MYYQENQSLPNYTGGKALRNAEPRRRFILELLEASSRSLNVVIK